MMIDSASDWDLCTHAMTTGPYHNKKIYETSVKSMEQQNLAVKHNEFLRRLRANKPSLFSDLQRYITNYKRLTPDSKLIQSVDEVFQFVPPTTETMVFYKGVSGKSSILPTDRFVSVSRDKHVAMAQGEALVVINVPGGSKVLFVDSVTPVSKTKQEVLIDMHGKFIVTLIKRGNFETPDTFYVVFLPHDTVTMKGPELSILSR